MGQLSQSIRLKIIHAEQHGVLFYVYCRRFACMNFLCLFNILFKLKNGASPVVIASFDAEKAFL